MKCLKRAGEGFDPAEAVVTIETMGVTPPFVILIFVSSNPIRPQLV